MPTPEAQSILKHGVRKFNGEAVPIRPLSLALALLLAGPIPAHASVSTFDIEASMRAYLASVTVQLPACGRAEAEGRAAADDLVSGNGWLIGSVLLPIVALGALASNPVPSTALLVGRSDEDAACFSEGYRQQARSKVRQKALIGGLIGLGLGFAVLSEANE